MRLSMIRELVGHAIDNGIASNIREALEHIEWCRWREDVYFERFEEARQPDPDRRYDERRDMVCVHGGY